MPARGTAIVPRRAGARTRTLRNRLHDAVLVALTATAALAQNNGDERDAVRLTNGKEVRGRVVLELEDRVVLRARTRDREIDRDDVESIDSIARHHAEALRRYRDGAFTSAAQLVELAAWCAEKQLEHEATLCHWRALLVDPNHRPAREALGHRERDGEWLMRSGRKWRTLAEANEYHGEWNTAWELRSEHFTMRCDSGLERTVHTLFELEFAYTQFLSLFQRELAIHELLEPVPVYVYRDRKQFPAAGTNVGVYFSTSENVLYTYVVGRSRPASLFHEATHAILHNATVRARRGRGRLPPWLDEGWADYMEAVIVPEGQGRTRLDTTRRYGDRVRTLAGDEKPYSLQRLMNFKVSDYGASSRQAIKYAQSYALFVHMIERDAYRERFLAYLREAIDGKGQASTFKRIFRREFADIEEDHLELR